MPPLTQRLAVAVSADRLRLSYESEETLHSRKLHLLALLTQRNV